MNEEQQGQRVVVTFEANDAGGVAPILQGVASIRGLRTIEVEPHPYDNLPPTPSVERLKAIETERFAADKTDRPPPAEPRPRKKTGRPSNAERAARAAAEAAGTAPPAANGNGVEDVSAVTHGPNGAGEANSFVSHAKQQAIPGS